MLAGRLNSALASSWLLSALERRAMVRLEDHLGKFMQSTKMSWKSG
jgi:hypothetical protein